MSYEARIALIEGDEHITSALDKRFQLEFYRPHIAILTNLSWSTETDHATPEAYLSLINLSPFLLSGKGIDLFGGDDTVSQLAGASGAISPLSLLRNIRSWRRRADFSAYSLRRLSGADSQSLFLDQSECGTFGLPAVRR